MGEDVRKPTAVHADADMHDTESSVTVGEVVCTRQRAPTRVLAHAPAAAATASDAVTVINRRCRCISYRPVGAYQAAGATPFRLQ